MLLAATYPERTSGLILVDAYASLAADDGYEGWDPGVSTPRWPQFANVWGTAIPVGSASSPRARPPTTRSVNDSRTARARFRQPGCRGRHATSDRPSRRAARSCRRSRRRRWCSCTATTRTCLPCSGGTSPNTFRTRQLVELDGADHLYWVGDADATLDEIEQFATGARSQPRAERVLATVLFTDIAGSTSPRGRDGRPALGRAARAHHAIVRRQLERFRGGEVKTMGDGFLAVFDGPAPADRVRVCDSRRCAPARSRRPRRAAHRRDRDERPDVGGIAVHIAQRVSALAEPGEVLVSRTVVDLVIGSGIQFADRGEHQLKGVPNAWQIFAVD